VPAMRGMGLVMAALLEDRHNRDDDWRGFDRLSAP